MCKEDWIGNLARRRAEETDEECRGKRLRAKDSWRNGTGGPVRVVTGTKGPPLWVKVSNWNVEGCLDAAGTKGTELWGEGQVVWLGGLQSWNMRAESLQRGLGVSRT